MKSGNPALGSKTFAGFGQQTYGNRMTVSGTVNKSIIMLALLVISAYITWNMQAEGGNIYPFVIGAAILAFVAAIVTHFVKRIAMVTAPIYAILEGVVLGGVSAMYQSLYNGIVQQAVILTFGVFAGLLFAYKTGLIRASENFRRGVIAATFGILIMYVANLILSFFGHQVPFLHDASPLGIGISVVIVIVAALNLVLDFDFIERGAENGAPKYMEWYSSLTLMITLVWLYLEILRLLSKIYSRN